MFNNNLYQSVQSSCFLKQISAQLCRYNTANTSYLHAGDQHHLEDMLVVGGGVSHGDVEGPVDAEGHLPQVALWLLPMVVVRHVDVGEHTVEVETRLLACNAIRNSIKAGLQLIIMFSKSLTSKCTSDYNVSCRSLEIRSVQLISLLGIRRSVSNQCQRSIVVMVFMQALILSSYNYQL